MSLLQLDMYVLNIELATTEFSSSNDVQYVYVETMKLWCLIG